MYLSNKLLYVSLVTIL